VHSELCTCCHNVEDEQNGKQDAQIIFWKFPYSCMHLQVPKVKGHYLFYVPI